MGEGDQGTPAAAGEKPVASFDSPDRKNTITFGRNGTNDVPLTDDVWIAPWHARIDRKDVFELVDLGSNSGVHHNGQRVVGRVRLADNDVFAIGRHIYRFFEGTVYESARNDAPVLLEAYDLSVQVLKRGQRHKRPWPDPLIDDVSFVVRRGTLLGIVGPSGSGKSTLLKAITGVQRATLGRLLFNKQDPYEKPGPNRDIGIVPQEDIFHTRLTVKRALRYAAALRCSRGTSRGSRHALVDSVVHQLGLDKQLHQQIESLSGGQRKRTSVAMELLTVPSLLCLDEPTSGLDPALDREIMGRMRDITKEHERDTTQDEKTVIVSTHNPLNLDACDYVLVMCLGRMVYFGPPGEELLAFFDHAEAYSDVFHMIRAQPDVWAQKYRGSSVYQRYVGAEQLTLLEAEAEGSRDDPTVGIAPTRADAPKKSGGPIAAILGRRPAPRPKTRATAARTDRPPTPARQLITLCARMISLILYDRKYALFNLGLPLAIGILSHLIPGSKGLSPDAAGFSLEANRLLIVLVVGAAFMGIALPIREIASEVPIYRRERAVGLSPTAYLLSKVLVFTVLDCIQATILVAVTLVDRGAPQQALVLPSATLEITVAVALVAITSTALGLLISTLVRTVDQTTPFLVFSVIAQLILSGALFQISGQATVQVLSWIDPSRWGYAAAAATTNFLRFPFTDPLWHHDADHWWHAISYLCVQIVAMLAVARWALRRYEHGRG